MKNLLIETLESLGFPVKLQGSIQEDEKYPDSFFTYWNNDTEDNNHYDNKTTSYTWDFDVNFYSVNPTLVNTKLELAKQELEKVGFIIDGKGHDLASDEPTHTGRGINVLKIEKN